MPTAADSDYSGARGFEQYIKEQASQCKVTEVVGAEMSFKAIFGFSIRHPHDPGVLTSTFRRSCAALKLSAKARTDFRLLKLSTIGSRRAFGISARICCAASLPFSILRQARMV